MARSALVSLALLATGFVACARGEVGSGTETVPSAAPSALVSKGDELWVVLGGKVLHYHDGRFEALPSRGEAKLVFMSPSGQLHASDGQVIVRYADDRWTPVGRFASPQPTLQSMAFDEHTYWASTRDIRDDDVVEAVHRLRKRPPG